MLIAIGGAVLIGLAALSAALAVHHRSSNVPLVSASPYRGSVPPPGIRAPDFTLRDYRGGRVTMSSFRGRVVVLSFVDSKCTTKCPIVTSVMARAIERLGPAQRASVVPLLMSVNPRIDTPTSIHRFLARRRALGLSYLIGSLQRMRPIWKAYGILSAAATGNADVHSSDVRIFDRRGIWVSTQHAGVDLTAANLDHDVLLALKRP